MDNNYKLFVEDIKKVHSPRKHKIINSYGVQTYFAYYRKIYSKNKKYVLTPTEYYKILRIVNKKLVEVTLLKGDSFKLPLNMGKIELLQYSIEPKINGDGKLIFKAPVDWNKTLELWYIDEEAKNDNLLLRSNNRVYIKTIYNKKKAIYKNKTAYKFTLNRDIKKTVNKLFKDKKIDFLKVN